MRWNIEETESMQRQRGIEDIDPTSFYTVINYAYNVYKNLFSEDIEGYIRFTVNFINNENMTEEKLFKFFID